VCAETSVAYFDLTEDTEVSEHIRAMNTKTFMMPQSGLAPGAVNIIASDLIRKFDTVEKVKMRVGALPKYPTNAMAYYLTWSTDGLINEYVNDCDVLSNHKHIKTQPLDGLEQVYIDGDRYEAFNTSGGSASMCDTFADKVKSLSYKTIRYPGHQASMKFLLDDLNLKHNKKKFVDLFDQEVPYTTADVVVMLVSVIGKKDGQLLEKTWSKKIYGEDGHSAIQRTTASGVCSVVTAYARGELTGEGFVSQESVDYKVFTNNKFGQVYS
jgi:saccharopine dehydrogenase-like NADP-dependent oxidoreductase